MDLANQPGAKVEVAGEPDTDCALLALSVPPAIATKADRVEILVDGERKAVLSWFHNRLHFHPRVLRLAFDGFDRIASEEIGPVIDAALPRVLAAWTNDRPLLFRATVAEDSALLPHLRRVGFLECRRVFEVSLATDDLQLLPKLEVDGQDRVVSLATARELASDPILENLFMEVYARVSRLDPATPERLTAEERRELFPGDGELDQQISSIAFRGARPVGVCPVYRTGSKSELELGALGATRSEVAQQSELALLMLRRTLQEAKAVGVRTLAAEVDSDASWSLYIYSELPCRVNTLSVSLAYMPRWKIT